MIKTGKRRIGAGDQIQRGLSVRLLLLAWVLINQMFVLFIIFVCPSHWRTTCKNQEELEEMENQPIVSCGTKERMSFAFHQWFMKTTQQHSRSSISLCHNFVRDQIFAEDPFSPMHSERNWNLLQPSTAVKSVMFVSGKYQHVLRLIGRQLRCTSWKCWQC